MKTLLILRHAKSSWNNANLTDHDRPLNKRGAEDAPLMGRLLLDHDLLPDLIITSSAERALSTAEAVALACDYEEEIVITRRLYLADPETYVDMLQELGADHACVMVVGHNPGMEELVTLLTGEEEQLTTANLVQVALPIDAWSALTADVAGTLVNLWRPKILP